jgi:hypothetical protein
MVELNVLFHTEVGLQFAELGIEDDDEGEFRPMSFILIDCIGTALDYEGRGLVFSGGLNYITEMSYEELKDFLTENGY